jgi:hypothetical protein
LWVTPDGHEARPDEGTPTGSQSPPAVVNELVRFRCPQASRA